MQMRQRALVVAAFGMAPLVLLGGCGDSSAGGASATLAELKEGTHWVTIAPATTPPTTAPPAADAAEGATSPNEQTYVVQGGDSLSKIAAKFDISLEALVNYNEWSDGLSHLILPGDEIKIPPNAAVPSADTGSGGTDTATADTSSGAGTETADAEATGEGCTHTVVAGDTPIKVAKQYDITVEELQNANVGNPVWNSFILGGTLNIPPEGC